MREWHEQLTVWLIVIWLRPNPDKLKQAEQLTVWLIVIWLRPGFVLVRARKKLTVWLTYFEPMRRSFDRSRKQLAMGFIGTHLSC